MISYRNKILIWNRLSTVAHTSRKLTNNFNIHENNNYIIIINDEINLNVIYERV